MDFSTLAIDTTQVLVLAGVIVTAIAGIWAVKKVIKLANRSYTLCIVLVGFLGAGLHFY